MPHSRAVGVTFTHALVANVRGTVDYSLATADWTARRRVELAVLAGRGAVARMRATDERMHDVTTTLETEIPRSPPRASSCSTS